jgi:uncharacterized protein YlaI
MNCPNCQKRIPHKVALKLSRIKVFTCPNCDERLVSTNFKTLNNVFGAIGVVIAFYSVYNKYIPGLIILIAMLVSWFTIVPFFLSYRREYPNQ